MKKLSAIILAMMMTVSLVACGGSKPEASAKPEAKGETPTEDTVSFKTVEKGTLTMATNAEFPPYEFREGEEFAGIDVEIAKMVAEKLGMTLKIEDMAFDSIIPSVTSGKADIGVAGLTVTEDRKKNVDFTNSYVKASQLIIIKKDNTAIKTTDDLKGKTIGVQLGTTGDIYAGDIEGATIERYNKGFEAVQALAQGKIDAVMIDDQVAKALAEQSPEVVVIEEPFTVEEYAIIVNKENPELTTAIN
ncbi:MAG: transporter substrate-binding domain-containing protein, partial [Oscillospiraceae bacterium]